MEWQEFRKEWEARLVQFAPTISAVPPTTQEEVTSQAVTRGQKRNQEEERFVGEGSGKDENLDYVNLQSDSDMEADGELSDYEKFVDSGTSMNDKGKRKVDEGQKQGGRKDREKGQEEETDADDEYDPHIDDNTVNEPNFICNENKETSWGKCYFKELEHDKVFGNGKTIRHPFY